MPDKVLLVIVGLIAGFVSFAAVGAATSFLIVELQERSVPHATTAPSGYAQVRDVPAPILR